MQLVWTTEKPTKPAWYWCRILVAHPSYSIAGLSGITSLSLLG
jgi:hypothetical protein